MDPKSILRLEGFALFAVAIGAYFMIGAPLWVLLVLALAPDLSMLGYLLGSRVGSRVYNAFHTLVAPAIIGTAGTLLGLMPLVWLALVWAAHIGADRAVGYGLKYPTGFKDSHLSGADDHRAPAVEHTGMATHPVGARDD